jgi:hypothetical protein
MPKDTREPWEIEKDRILEEAREAARRAAERAKSRTNTQEDTKEKIKPEEPDDRGLIFRLKQKSKDEIEKLEKKRR